MRRVLLASAFLLVASLPGTTAPPAQPAENGSITGRVKLTARAPRAPLSNDAYPVRGLEKRVVPATPEIRNVVVYLKGLAYRGPLPTFTREMRQENETFVPHVLPITRGSTVDFPNGDPFFHNVFSLSAAGTFNLGRYPRGQSRARVFAKAGLVKVYCDIHSHMSAAILVLDNPFFTIPDVDGTFEIPGVPPGQYTLVGWHERVGERSVPVRVEAGKPTTVQLTVPVEDAK